MAYTLAPWANYAARGYHKPVAEAQYVGPAAVDALTGELWIAQSQVAGYHVSAPILKVNATTLAPTGMVTTVGNSSGLAYVAADHAMYVSDPGTGNVIELNASTGAVITTVQVGADAGNLTYDPGRFVLYAVVQSNDTVAEISVNTTQVLRWSVALGNPLGDIAYDPMTNDIAVNTAAGLDWLRGSTLYLRTSMAIAGTPASVAIDQNGYAYVGTVGGDVTVANLTTTVAGPSSLGGTNAAGAVFDPALRAVVFTLRGSNSVALVDTTTQTVSTTYPITADGPTAIVIVPGTHQVDVLSATSLYPQYSTDIYPPPAPLGRTVAAVDDLTGVTNVTSRNLASAPTTISYNPDGGTVIVGDRWSNNLSVVSAASPSAVPTTEQFVNGSVGEIGYDPLTHTLWVPFQVNLYGPNTGNWNSANLLEVLNASTFAEVAPIWPAPPSQGGPHTVDGIFGAMFDPGTGNMLVFYNDNGPVQLDVEAYSATTYQIAMGPVALGSLCCTFGALQLPGWALDAAHHRLFVTSTFTNQLYILDTRTLAIDAVLGVGSLPLGVAFDPADGDAYVANSGSYNLTIVNESTLQVVVPNVPMLGIPQYVTYDPSTELLYVGVQSGVGLFPTNLETTLVVLDGSSLSAVWGPWPTIYVGNYLYLTPQTATFVPSTAPGMPGQIWNTNLFDGTVTVISVPPWVISLVPSSPTVEAGGTLGLTTTLYGGTDGWTAVYSGLPSGCTSASTLTLSCVPTTPGTYQVSVTVTDGFGETSSAQTNVTVQSGLALTASVQPETIDVGQTVWANATTTGGSGPVNLSWSFGDGAWGWGAGVSHVYPAPGTYRVLLNATDGLGMVQSFAGAVTVNALPTLSVTSSPSAATIGTAITFQSTAAGGTSPWSAISWTFGDGSTGTGAAPTHTYATSGSFTVNASATDAYGNLAKTSTVVTVTALPALAVALSLGANQTSPHAPVSLFATTSGGEPAYAYAWTLNGSATTGSGATLSYTPAGAGNYSFSVVVTDAAGSSATAHVVLEVLPPSVVTVTVPTPVPGPTKYVYSNQTAPVGLSALLPYAGLGIGLGLLVGLLLGALLFRRRKEGSAHPSGSGSAVSSTEKNEKTEEEPAPEPSSSSDSPASEPSTEPATSE